MDDWFLRENIPVRFPRGGLVATNFVSEVPGRHAAGATLRIIADGEKPKLVVSEGDQFSLLDELWEVVNVHRVVSASDPADAACVANPLSTLTIRKAQRVRSATPRD